MDPTTFVIWIVLGLIAGFLVETVMHGPRSNMLVDVIVGVLGAILGGWLSTALLGRPVTGLDIPSLLIAFIGGVILVWIVRAATAGRAGV